CQDGLTEPKLNELLKKFGAYGRPLSSFLDAGVKVSLSQDGKTATVTALVRYKDRPNDPPVMETTRWKLEPKGSWVLIDMTEGGGVAPAPKGPPPPPSS